MEKISLLSIPEQDARVIVISDLHGELDLFQQLLKKVGYCAEDYLIINGDLCEKGSNSSGVVRYVMDLCKTDARVHVVEGNCDTLAEEIENENPDVIRYLRSGRRSILTEWLEQLAYFIDEKTTIQDIKKVLMRHLSEEIQWLLGLPTVIESQDYIFVHAGLSDIENWKDTDRETAISVPFFLNKTHQANKYVVVGHYPVSNYPSDYISNNPVVDSTKRIISIDGGNVIKRDGQLNAFIIHRSPSGDTFSRTYVDRFPECKVIKDFTAEPQMAGSITYPHLEVVPLERGLDFTLCQQSETKHLVYVKNEYVLPTENGLATAKSDVSCAQISVRQGDVVSLIDDTCTGYALIKQDGLVGWVAKDSLSGLIVPV